MTSLTCCRGSSRGGRDNSKNSAGCPVTVPTRPRSGSDNSTMVCRHRQGRTVTHGLPSNYAAPEMSLQGASLTACGLALTAFASQVLASPTSAARLLGQLINAGAGEQCVALRLCDLGSGRQAYEALSLICDKIGCAFQRAGLDHSMLEITVDAGAVAPQAAWEIRRKTLGAGTVNLVLSDALMSSALRPGALATDSLWLQLWRLRSSSVVSAFWPSASSRCALLSSEYAADVVPDIGLQAPGQSAWLSYELDLLEFADASGAIDENALQRSLWKSIDDAEEMHDTIAWPTPAMQQDGWFNRRLAIRIAGIGDIVMRRGLDPELHASVLELDRLIRYIRCTAERRSRQIARTRETLPAITAVNPCRNLRAGHVREAWERRWSRAIERSAMRHRNLIVMSPWSVFPHNCTNYRYANLLPLLRHADACEFRRRNSLARWNIKEFRRFHHRAWAVRRRIESATVVAERL